MAISITGLCNTAFHYLQKRFTASTLVKILRSGAHLGVGYLHSIPGTDRFELNDDGEYEKIKNLGRAQGMGKISFSGLYRVNSSYSLSLNYGVIMQGPFVKSYVPLLPYNTIQLGVHKSITR